jgi:hypothetical protein
VTPAAIERWRYVPPAPKLCRAVGCSGRHAVAFGFCAACYAKRAAWGLV